MMVTHKANEIEQSCDKFGILLKGELIKLNKPQTVLDELSNGYKILMEINPFLTNLQEMTKIAD